MHNHTCERVKRLALLGLDVSCGARAIFKLLARNGAPIDPQIRLCGPCTIAEMADHELLLESLDKNPTREK